MSPIDSGQIHGIITEMIRLHTEYAVPFVEVNADSGEMTFGFRWVQADVKAQYEFLADRLREFAAEAKTLAATQAEEVRRARLN